MVALGASAGGLAPLEQFFEAMPASCGMSFVVVTHQHAGHASLLTDLLQRRASLPVVEVASDTPLQIDHIYTVRPGFMLACAQGVLHPTPMGDGGTAHLPIDHFFRSLAKDCKERSVAIILSGTGSDGSLGLSEIKFELGLVMVQDPQTAAYTGMPSSAIATSLVDYVLPAAAMPEKLLAYANSLAAGREHAVKADSLKRILLLLRERVGQDFSHYKQRAVLRRIERRMHLHHIARLQEYLNFLQSEPSEIHQLSRDLLIGVTAFFRDPEAWCALADQLCALISGKPSDYVLRAWVAGCSTGEEAYSLAIVLREVLDSLERAHAVQIFATDLNATAIETARFGVYPFGIVNDVSAARLARFFIQEESSYRVKKELREMVVFAPQNLLVDPPFTRLDVLCCRNVLIYLDAKLQQRLLPVLHYSLRTDGLLFLGASESVSAGSELFSLVDKLWKIFRRNEVAPDRSLRAYPRTAPALPGGAAASRAAVASPEDPTQLERIVRDALLTELVPPTVLVREDGDIVHVHGRTGTFLDPAQGSPSDANLFDMVRPELRASLGAALRQALSTDGEVTRRGALLKHGADASVELRVRRLREPAVLSGLLCVSFEHVHAAPAPLPAVLPPSAAPAAERVLELERQLRVAAESHRGTVEELNTANEELKSTNEELQSTNEELQSANEELATSKEELQSLNEALQTVNAELHGKIEELSQVTNDMKNLLNATDIATLFLDKQLRIKRYTEQAKSIIHLIETDLGRPLGDLSAAIRYDRLVEDAQEVLRTLVPKEVSLEAAHDARYLMRILPYRTTENVIDGLVLTFVDVTRLQQLQRDQERLLGLLESSPASLFGQDRELRYTWAFSSAFGHPPAELLCKSDQDIFDERDAQQLKRLKQEVFATGLPVRGRVELTVQGARRTYELYLEAERERSGSVTGLCCLAMDVTITV